MRFHVLTLFPAMFESPLSESILARARATGLVTVDLHNIREFSHDRHNTVDDYPFGGGYGMVLKPEPLFEAVEHVFQSNSLPTDTPKVLLTPQGQPFNQKIAESFASHEELVLICGRYEGVDERVREYLVTHEVSIGDYVLSGGEIPAMVLIDAVSRLIPGVVGSLESTQDDSFTTGLIQHPQYTRPAVFRGWAVPDVLLSGNHAEIARWRRETSVKRTAQRRPDLLTDAALDEADMQILEQMQGESQSTP